MESFQKRQRDRRKREKRNQKADRRKDRAEMKKREDGEDAQTDEALTTAIPDTATPEPAVEPDMRSTSQ